MKRKLPQWLLDVTKNNNVNTKNIKSHNQNENENSTECNPSESSGMITLVPLSNLLSPTRVGQNDFSARNNEVSNSPRIDVHMNRDTSDDPMQPVVKTEIIEEVSSSLNIARLKSSDQSSAAVVIKTEIKEEATTSDTGAASTAQSPTASTTNAIVDQKINVKNEVTTAHRRSCHYGLKCYRRNPAHRSEEAHPGDSDYRRPTFPDAAPGTPACPWGAACYRRNPQHFVQLSHPPAMNATPMTPNAIPQTTMPSRIRRPVNYQNLMSTDIDSEDEEDEDPFINDDSSDEYVPDGENIHEDDLDETPETDS